MVERLLGPVLGHRVLFLALAAALFFWRLLPIPNGDYVFPGPDLLLCLVFCWTLRRPDYLPFWLIAGVIFVEDLLMMRPPGLWALLVLGGAEFLRARGATTRSLSFGVEWVFLSGVMALLFTAYRLVLALVLLPQSPINASLVHLIVTIAAYPLVVGTSVMAFGLRRPSLGETTSTGRRI